MKRTALTTLILAATSLAAAQQTVRATYAPVTIDGVTTTNGAVVIGGKTYISQDALTARGLTLLRPNSFGLYQFPRGTGPALKLAGCRNEWLYNGRLRARVLDTAATEKGWEVKTEMQANPASGDSLEIARVLDLGKTLAAVQGSQVFDPSKSPFESVTTSYPWARRTETLPITFTLADADGSKGRLLNRFVLVSQDRTAPQPLTFDLTCTR